MSDTAILDLDALTTALGRFRLDGIAYEFHRWDSLTLRQRLRVGHINDRLREIEQDDDTNAEDETEYQTMLHELISTVSTMTAEQAQAADQDKVREAVTAFLGARQARQIEMIAKISEMTGRATGATSSPASNRATRRAARKAG